MFDPASIAMIGTLLVAITAGYIAWRKAPGEISETNVKASAALVATALQLSQSQTATINKQVVTLEALGDEISSVRGQMVDLQAQLKSCADQLGVTQERLVEANAELRALKRLVPLLEDQITKLEHQRAPDPT